jgi:DeoR/GlpR family transcriptional regulator of sugar metabolism
MIGHAQTAVLLATPQKFEDRGLSIVARADRIDVAYVIDRKDASVDVLERAGVDVHRIA